MVQGTIGCTRNSVPMVFIGIITHRYPLYRAYIGISHRSTLVGVHPTTVSPEWLGNNGDGGGLLGNLLMQGSN